MSLKYVAVSLKNTASHLCTIKWVLYMRYGTMYEKSKVIVDELREGCRRD